MNIKYCIKSKRNLKHDQDTNNKIQELVLLPWISKVLQTHAHVSYNLQCNLQNVNKVLDKDVNYQGTIYG